MRHYIAQSAARRAADSAEAAGAPFVEQQGQGAPAVFGTVRDRSQDADVEGMAAHAAPSGGHASRIASEGTLSAVEARERLASGDDVGGSSMGEEPALE
jgi:hypothetical protein